MKHLARLVSLLLLATFSCGQKEKTVAVAGISLSERSLALRTGDVATLTVRVWPEGATDPAVTWTSSNAAVASVSEGTVTALSEGVTTISARTVDGGFEASCLVSVTDYHAEGIAITPGEDVRMRKGETLQFSATITPENANNRSVVWETSDDAVLTVDNTGLATAIAGGTATVKVTAVDGGFSASVNVTVIVPVAGVTLSEETLTLTAGQSYQGLTATVTPEDATDKTLTWNTSDPAVLQVTAGPDGTVTLKALREGTATVTVTAVDGGRSATVDVTVTKAGGDTTGGDIHEDDYGEYE